LGREAGWRWAAFAITYQTLLAWMVATGYYQVMTFAQAPARAAVWLGSVTAMTAGGIGCLALLGKRIKL